MSTAPDKTPADCQDLPADPLRRPSPQTASVLEIIHRLKAQIREKDRILSERVNKLLGTRDYLKSLFLSLSLPALVFDTLGRIEAANQAALELLGCSEAALLGQPATILWSLPGQAALFEEQRLQELIASRGSHRATLQLQTQRGEAIPVAWSSSVLSLEEGPVGLVGIARDLRVELRLEEEKLRAIRALAASVAHEIRNPLAAIQNSVGLLLRDLDLAEEDQVLMDIVHKETQRISGIVTQFLTFARPLEIDLHSGDLGGLLEEVIILARRDERAQGKTIHLQLSPALAPLPFDADQIKQVAWNLLQNALDASQSEVRVEVSPTPQGGVEVGVKDDGAGIPPELLARVTEPFHTTKAQGTGLGLAISKRIVEAHGGALRLGGAPGVGATVSFSLPGPDGA